MELARRDHLWDECVTQSMSVGFSHNQLDVYRKAVIFVGYADDVLRELPRSVAVCHHLDRAAESIPLNLAHASSTWSPKERGAYLTYAIGSVFECAACLDVLAVKRLAKTQRIIPGKRVLAEIARMLIGMHKASARRIKEDREFYHAEDTFLFSHEKLEVYQLSLAVAGDGVEQILAACTCSGDLRTKVDKSTSAIPLNIAEGNGRFSPLDQMKFLGIAYKATIQSASLLDILAAKNERQMDLLNGVRSSLHRIKGMLQGLVRTVKSGGIEPTARDKV